MFRKMRIRKKNVCSFFHFKIQSCRQQQEMIWIELVFSKKWNMWPFKIHIENLQDVGVNFIIRIFHCYFFSCFWKLISMKLLTKINKCWLNVRKNDQQDQWLVILIMNLKFYLVHILILYPCVGKLVSKKKRRILFQNHLLPCIDPGIRT